MRDLTFQEVVAVSGGVLGIGSAPSDWMRPLPVFAPLMPGGTESDYVRTKPPLESPVEPTRSTPTSEVTGSDFQPVFDAVNPDVAIWQGVQFGNFDEAGEHYISPIDGLRKPR